MNTKPIQSPSYPVLHLSKAVEAVGKIEGVYRTSAASREDSARLIGFSSLSGPANKALAALASYGLVERAGKGMMKVTPLAVNILHPETESAKVAALTEAASTPKLFGDIREQFPDLPVPPERGVITYLNRAGFNPSAVPKAASAFLETARFIESLEVSESHGDGAELGEGSSVSAVDERFGGATVGDLIQWESAGTLRFESPRRVRWVSEDGNFLAVEGSETGVPMNEVTVESRPSQIPPTPPPLSPASVVANTSAKTEGFTEWFRAKVGADKLVSINYCGEGDIGAREIEKMIAILEAQKVALED